MTFSMLNLSQSSGELDEVHRTDYYWYLHSQPFRETFLEPLGDIVNRLGRPCLDVGCGEGWLADYVTVPYVGIDGSVLAILRAEEKHPQAAFHWGRVEDPPRGVVARRCTVVFGNLLAVTIRNTCHVAFLELYATRFAASALIVYDLEQVDTSAIEQRFRLIESRRASVEMPEIDKVKRHRKILVFSCN